MRGYRITPAVALIGQEIDRAIREPDQRLIIVMPPREGKSTTAAVLGTLAALRQNPGARIILSSYADELAEKHSREARQLIAEHSDLLGLVLSPDKASAGQWTLYGHRGGLLASGLLSGLTGHGTDGLLIVDDVVKNMTEADSPTYRRRVVAEFRSTLMTRIEPGASVIVIGTRWHPEDLIGTLLAEEPDRWRTSAFRRSPMRGCPIRSAAPRARSWSLPWAGHRSTSPTCAGRWANACGGLSFKASQHRPRATSSGASGWTPGGCPRCPATQCGPSSGLTRPTAARATRPASSRPA